MQLIQTIIHPALSSTQGKCFKRKAARAVVQRDDKILLLFTERYNDFSFPGGGIDPDEDIITALHRELREETGAQNIEVVHNIGHIEEFQPYWKPEYDLVHMFSHFYACNIDLAQQEVQMEDYEIANGMRPVWVNLQEALAHNQAVIKHQEKTIGLSIYRETFMLEKVAKDMQA